MKNMIKRLRERKGSKEEAKERVDDVKSLCEGISTNERKGEENDFDAVDVLQDEERAWEARC